MFKGQTITMKVKLPKKVVILNGVRRVGDHFPDRYEIDKKLPKKYRKSLILHEIVEDEIQKTGLTYKKAHRLANKIERKMFPHGDKDWDNYNNLVTKIYYQNKANKVM
jgi:hypothetical protein